VILPPEPLDDEFHLVVVFSNDPSLKQVNPQAKRAQNTTQNNPVKRSKGRINKKKKKNARRCVLSSKQDQERQISGFAGQKAGGFLGKRCIIRPARAVRLDEELESS
jgi:hypothetical protein